MKRLLLIAFALALSCLVLAACGGLRNDTPVQSPAATMDLIPEISPVLTPDVDDGVVKDRDGIIEDREPGVSAAPSARPSESPKVSAKP